MSARVAAAQARREQEFLELAADYEDRLLAAKEALAANPGDAEVVAEHRAAADAMHGFRTWARTVGEPKAGVPGRDAVITMGA